MLDEFVTFNRDAILAATCAKAQGRLLPRITGENLRSGVPVFLAQLSETLRRESSPTPFSPTAIGDSATRHGADLSALGFTVSEVVHVYGDICQAITELAVAQDAPVTVDEFRILNRSLDTAIAEAVTEHARRTATQTSADHTERLGQLSHELRNHAHTALLALAVLKGGTVAINGTTGDVLGRSLTSLQALIDSTISEVRLAAKQHRRQPVSVPALLADVGATASLLSDHHRTRFSIEPIDPALVVEGDRQLLLSALMNLLQNAFKFTPPNGLVVLRAHAVADRVTIEVEDACGGYTGASDTFQPFAERTALDQSGLGLGLSIARQAVHAHEGNILVRNTAGGCIFAIDLPLAHRARAGSGATVNKVVG
jgi:signal transduction histidine kinase